MDAAGRGNREGSREKVPDSAWVWRMSKLTQEGTAEPLSRHRVLRHELGQGNFHFSCSVDHEQDWQPYPVDLQE